MEVIPGLFVLLGITWRQDSFCVIFKQFLSNLDLSSSEERIIQSHGSLHRVLVGELYIRKPLGMTIILVTQNSHSEQRHE